MEEMSEKKKVLVVDDEEKFGKMVQKNLEKTGRFEVKYETKGSHALELVRDYRPDIVLLDVLMPDMRGPEVAFKIREDEKLAKTKIIFVTATIKKGLNEGFGGLVGGRPFTIKPVVSKPVNTKDLMKAIDAELNAAAA